MAKDYGYFGKGAAGYAHYMQAFNSTYKRGGGGNGSGPSGGCLGAVLVVLVVGRVLWPFR